MYILGLIFIQMLKNKKEYLFYALAAYPAGNPQGGVCGIDKQASWHLLANAPNWLPVQLIKSCNVVGILKTLLGR
jgi:hypothetical protein